MANLLPQLEKKKIKKEYKIRLSITASLFVAGLVAIAGILLLPSFILSSYKYNSAVKQLNVEKKKISDSSDGIDPIKTAKNVNAQLVVLGQKGYLTPLSYDVFTVIVGYKPKGVKINSIFYDRMEEEGTVSVNGVSKDRKTLLSFLQSLEQEEMFSSVELPISSFVEGQDINFSIRITIKRGSTDSSNTNNKSNEE
jgi:Tfp pilus assembly protein PilN